MSALTISLLLGMVAGAANILGGMIVSARAWSRAFLSACIALGAGFMLATVITEMIPEGLRLQPARGPLLILGGYFIVHFFEHSLPAHFHFGEETHTDQFLNPRVANAALGGLLIHTFFAGVAIASSFMISAWLGTVVFGATLLHNMPEGFTMASIMVAARRSRAAGLLAVTALAISRIAGILAMGVFESLVPYGLTLSAGVTLYVAASDLIPEVNKRHGGRVALTVAVGIGLVLLLRMLFLGRPAP